MASYSIVFVVCIRHVALRTEGCQVGDLNSLVDRAISSSHIRHTCPDSVRLRLGSPLKKQGSTRVSFTLDDLEMVQESLGEVRSPLITRSLPSSPLKERKRLKAATKSLSFVESHRRPQSTENVNLSVQTLTERVESRFGTYEAGKLRLCDRDFEEGLAGFAPLALRSLSLHSSGTVDFSHVGGMDETKKTLRETIQWPSMVKNFLSFSATLFSPCDNLTQDTWFCPVCTNALVQYY